MDKTFDGVASERLEEMADLLPFGIHLKQKTR